MPSWSQRKPAQPLLLRFVSAASSFPCSAFPAHIPHRPGREPPPSLPIPPPAPAPLLDQPAPAPPQRQVFDLLQISDGSSFTSSSISSSCSAYCASKRAFSASLRLSTSDTPHPFFFTVPNFAPIPVCTLMRRLLVLSLIVALIFILGSARRSRAGSHHQQHIRQCRRLHDDLDVHGAG